MPKLEILVTGHMPYASKDDLLTKLGELKSTMALCARTKNSVLGTATAHNINVVIRRINDMERVEKERANPGQKFKIRHYATSGLNGNPEEALKKILEELD